MGTQQFTNLNNNIVNQLTNNLQTTGNLWYSHVLWYSHRLWLGGLFTNQTMSVLGPITGSQNFTSINQNL